jgi:hypothetical protein
MDAGLVPLARCASERRLDDERGGRSAPADAPALTPNCAREGVFKHDQVMRLVIYEHVRLVFLGEFPFAAGHSDYNLVPSLSVGIILADSERLREPALSAARAASEVDRLTHIDQKRQTTGRDNSNGACL